MATKDLLFFHGHMRVHYSGFYISWFFRGWFACFGHPGIFVKSRKTGLNGLDDTDWSTVEFFYAGELVIWILRLFFCEKDVVNAILWYEIIFRGNFCMRNQASARKRRVF